MPSGVVRGKHARWYAPDMLRLVMGVLAGCTGDGGGADYTLHLTPVTSSAQNPFEGLDRIDLVLTPASGEPLRVTLGAPTSGSTPEVTGLPPLEETRITVEGYRDGLLAMRGLTEPLTASSGTVEAEVFVARTDASAWMEPLAEGLHLPLVAPLGNGRFWIGGGVTNNRGGEPRKGNDLTQVLSLAPPAEGLAFTTSGALPTYTDADGVEQTARMGATFTPLTVAGADQGKLLVTGGSSTHPFLYDGQTTKNVALFDPATESWEPVESELGEFRSLHVAIENLLGHVVVWGGLGLVDFDGVELPNVVEFYDRDARTITEVGQSNLGHLSATAADLGSDGSLLCGGARLGGSGWTSSTTCSRVPIDGGSVESFTDLPAGLAGAAMLTLDDGRVLLTGGATASTTVDSATYVAARTSAWLYNPETGQWGSLSSSMAVARAGHRMVALADGRVLVIGGAETYNPFFPPPDPVSCIEIYDPDDGSFTSVDDCDASDDAGGLPNRAYEPQVAYDPDYGVLVVGGLAADGSAATGVSLFVPVM